MGKPSQREFMEHHFERGKNVKEKSISKKTHAKILGVQYGIYKIIYDRGWDDAMYDYTNDDKPEATKKEIKAWKLRK